MFKKILLLGFLLVYGSVASAAIYHQKYDSADTITEVFCAGERITTGSSGWFSIPFRQGDKKLLIVDMISQSTGNITNYRLNFYDNQWLSIIKTVTVNISAGFSLDKYPGNFKLNLKTTKTAVVPVATFNILLKEDGNTTGNPTQVDVLSIPAISVTATSVPSFNRNSAGVEIFNEATPAYVVIKNATITSSIVMSGVSKVALQNTYVTTNPTIIDKVSIQNTTVSVNFGALTLKDSVQNARLTTNATVMNVTRVTYPTINEVEKGHFILAANTAAQTRNALWIGYDTWVNNGASTLYISTVLTPNAGGNTGGLAIASKTERTFGYNDGTKIYRMSTLTSANIGHTVKTSQVK